MTVICSVRKLIRRETGALAADCRGGAGMHLAMIMVAIVSAIQVAALMGVSLQQSFAQLNGTLGVLHGG